MPRTIVVVTVILILAAGWYFLLFPESVNNENATAAYETHKTAMREVTKYLVNNHISADITGLFTPNENYGVVKIDDAAYSDLADAVEELMRKDFTEIISDGRTVEFVCRSTGGHFTKVYGSVIYNGESKVDGKETVPLDTKGWHLYIEKVDS